MPKYWGNAYAANVGQEGGIRVLLTCAADSERQAEQKMLAAIQRFNDIHQETEVEESIDDVRITMTLTIDECVVVYEDDES